MHVVKSRWLALAAICLSLSLVSGCQIDGGGVSSGGDLRYVKLSPDLNLHAAPEGYVYELWILRFAFEIIEDGDTVIVIPQVGEPASVARFNWDPYLYAATDVNGDYMPLTLPDGMEVPNLDLNSFFAAQTNGNVTTVAFLSIEPENDPTPSIPNGPTLTAINLNPESKQGVMLNSWELVPFFGLPVPNGTYTLLSQSNKKGTPAANWRDNETEGYGIWFANPRLEDNTTLDSVNAWDAYSRLFVPTNSDAYTYVVWIHKTHPESSFSNFGRVLENREPDFEIRDGFPSHSPGRYGPSQTINRQDPDPDLPGVQLGSDPVIIDNQVVGYRYIINHPGTPTANPPVAPHVDTCIIRIDHPELTRCASDTFQVLDYDTVNVLPKAFRITNGDTSMGPTLATLLDISDVERLNEVTQGNGFIFLGWEYEAWVLFTQESGIPPLSLGRFKSPNAQDSENPYTFTDQRYDRNFHYPGEDFLQGIQSHHPSLTGPLDVIYDPRVEKLWITIEPDDDYLGQNLDWAPDEPNSQLIILSAYLPNQIDTVQSAQFPMVYRDLNPSPTGLNNGNFFPRVTVQFLPEPVE